MYTYEVFLKPDGRDGFAHAGSLDAPDDEMAVLYARETYCRRGEGTLAWVVRRSKVLVVDPVDLAVTARRSQGINDGTLVAARRRAKRAGVVATTSDTGDNAATSPNTDDE
jgi:phenylacetate-CoA oxygenase PaaH subunit